MKQRKSKLVYSTDSGQTCPRCRRFIAHCSCKNASPHSAGDGVVRLFRETKGRKGKGVTLIRGLPLNAAGLSALAKQMKSKCGVGGAVKENTIELQTADREQIQKLLEAMGYTVKIAGG